MKTVLQSYWSQFSKKEKFVMKSLSTSSKVTRYKQQLDYLETNNLIKNNKVTGKWINYVANDKAEVEFKFENTL